jgi:phenylalanyl-tRNA synthetase beta chain
VYGAVAKSTKNIIKYQPDEVNRMLGMPVSPAIQANLLKRLGCQIKKANSQIAVTVPTWRSDLGNVADLTEEIGRHVGYDKIRPEFLSGINKPLPDRSKVTLCRPIKNRLVAIGFNEMYSYSFYGADLVEYSGLDIGRQYMLSNPMNPEQQYLRTSLVPRLLENLKRNQNQFEIIKLFEIGTTFQINNSSPKEIVKLAGVITSKDNQIEKILRLVKGIVRELIGSEVKYRTLAPGQYQVDNGSGIVRVWSADNLNKLKINQTVVSFEIEIIGLIGRKSQRIFRPYSIFPAMQRDFSLIAPDNLLYDDIAKEIESINVASISDTDKNGLIKSVNQYGETYRNARIGTGKKNLTIRCIFQSDHRTLTSTEVDKLTQQIITRLTTSLGVALSGDARSK